MRVADKIWLATALLHLENPDREDFSVAEIVQRSLKADLGGEFQPGLQIHASVHCVASKPPNPGRYRMLHETARGRRRLFRQGDPYHPYREGGRIRPDKSNLAAAYAHVVDWYDRQYLRTRRNAAKPKRKTSEIEINLSAARKKITPLSDGEIRTQILSVYAPPLGRKRTEQHKSSNPKEESNDA